MITQVIADIHLLNLSILVLALHEHLLEEVVIVLLHLLVGHSLPGHVTAISSFSRVLRVNVEVLENNSLAESGFVVDPTAPVTVTTGSYLEIKAAVDFVLLCAED